VLSSSSDPSHSERSGEASLLEHVDGFTEGSPAGGEKEPPNDLCRRQFVCVRPLPTDARRAFASVGFVSISLTQFSQMLARSRVLYKVPALDLECIKWRLWFVYAETGSDTQTAKAVQSFMDVPLVILSSSAPVCLMRTRRGESL
jgi:hypothetical protein